MLDNVDVDIRVGDLSDPPCMDLVARERIVFLRKDMSEPTHRPDVLKVDQSIQIMETGKSQQHRWILIQCLR
ncbi:hypothetical protein Rhe02_08550 [Rhizocola hellebori]|uniref:Uncharacterized protein n=1 Tax=Rhizocola hellebori TaxID=1392758 RepID=A0A8J3VE61_9ACTN|nr:hypothetical protein Rhe02_08550 [Rhizocola hellebori]